MDLILAAVKNRNWPDIKYWANSIMQSGFAGEVVLLHQYMDEDSVNRLRKLDFELVNFNFRQDVHFQTARYEAAIEYLEHSLERRYVIWTDVTDLVFQLNPSNWLDSLNGIDLIVAQEGWKIKNQPINDEWIKRISTSEEHAIIRERPVLCSGSIAGTHKAILDLFKCMSSKFFDPMQGIDQGIFNYFMWSAATDSTTFMPSMRQGWAATCGQFLSAGNKKEDWVYDPPYFSFNEGVVWTPNKIKPFVIAHQYNRRYGICDPQGTFKEILEKRYQ